jgi:Na+-translocating ferredoxin:NAD+ oxidoreductase RNF subunit RnfB
MGVLVPILIFGAIGIFMGVILTFSGRFFRVKIDNRIEELTKELPALNCGACGFASCERYATAIINENVAPNQCKPGGAKTAEKIGVLLGEEVAAAEPDVAFIRCGGICNESDSGTIKFDYKGSESCSASELYYNGNINCRFGCTGLGDCVRVCPENAITLKDGKAVVSDYLCNACGLCVKTCPKGIIKIQKANQIVRVSCSSKDKGKITRSICSNGCIGCKVCERKCPQNAIQVRDNLAHIDSNLCDNCWECVGVCPTKCITAKRDCDFME